MSDTEKEPESSSGMGSATPRLSGATGSVAMLGKKSTVDGIAQCAKSVPNGASGTADVVENIVIVSPLLVEVAVVPQRHAMICLIKIWIIGQT